MEQPALAGIGNSRLGIRSFRSGYFRTIPLYGIHYPRGYRSGLLSDCRRTYEHAVRMGKEKSRQQCFHEKGIYAPIQPDNDSLQRNLVDTDNSAFYRADRLQRRLYRILYHYNDQARC